ncbi:hypothetical protein V8E55_001025 [Tylopilus felleus]
MRPLVQYDLDESPVVHPAPLTVGPQPTARQPPTKKRKRNHRNPQPPSQKVLVQHWDDPGSTAVGMVYDEEGSTSMAAGSASVSFADHPEEEDEYGEEAAEGDEGADADADGDDDESRPLTHEEMWDDSALVDAWNSAEAEYEAYHGTSKAWKTEPVKKSPLWYNKPYTPQPGTSKPKPRSKYVPQAQGEDGDVEPDSVPLNFDTFVPTHDPSFAMPSLADTGAASAAATAPFFVPLASMATVTLDEAFNNALSAMYWTGYWTAVYHCQNQTSHKKNNGPAEATEGNEIIADEDEDEEDLVPAQR